MKDLERAEQPKFFLIAGERTRVICKGSLYHCLNNLWRVNSEQVGPCGVGSWIIVDEEGGERESGWFDADSYWFASQQWKAGQ